MAEVTTAIQEVQREMANPPPAKQDWGSIGLVALMSVVLTLLLVGSLLRIGVVNFLLPGK